MPTRNDSPIGFHQGPGVGRFLSFLASGSLLCLLPIWHPARFHPGLRVGGSLFLGCAWLVQFSLAKNRNREDRKKREDQLDETSTEWQWMIRMTGIIAWNTPFVLHQMALQAFQSLVFPHDLVRPGPLSSLYRVAVWVACHWWASNPAGRVRQGQCRWTRWLIWAVSTAVHDLWGSKLYIHSHTTQISSGSCYDDPICKITTKSNHDLHGFLR